MGGTCIVIAGETGRRPASAPRLARLVGGDGEVVEDRGAETLALAALRWRAAGVALVGVVGGDAAVGRVATALARAWGTAPLPRLLLLGGGGVDALARAHGLSGPPERLLAEALAATRPGEIPRVADRDLLRVEADGGPPAYGFVAGTGLAVAFHRRWEAAGAPGRPGTALLLARAAGSALVGGPLARALDRRAPLRIRADGEAWQDGGDLGLLAGTVPSIGLGFRALARCDEQPGFFHAIGLHGSLARLARLLPRIHRGAPWPRRAAFDAVVRELTVEGEGIELLLDGARRPPAERIRLASGPAIALLLPPRRRAGAV